MNVTASVLAFIALATGAGDSAREVRVVMGTVAEIRVAGASEPDAAIAAAFDRIARTESSLSIWSKDSEISRLNGTGDAQLSELAFDAVARSIAIARDSKGAFDPTLSPEGFAGVDLDRAHRRVGLRPGLTLDLGAVAKGYAVELALEALEGKASRALVDLGTSSIALFGDALVTFEVRDPEGGDSPATFQLRRGAIGSSSRDQLGEHIRDPRAGRPADSSVKAVTIVSPSAFEADALSTAVFVLGAEEGLALTADRGAAGLVVLEENGETILVTTPGFAETYALEVREGVPTRVASTEPSR